MLCLVENDQQNSKKILKKYHLVMIFTVGRKSKSNQLAYEYLYSLMYKIRLLLMKENWKIEIL